MATVTKPIALDETLHTTENPSRNIADVLAEELARIAENILPPSAEDIAYDNTGSGLNATNVQDAIDEVISSQADVIADTMADLTENKTATITDGVADFETIDGSLVKSLVINVDANPSGYTQADVLVVGKNLLDRSTFVDGYVNTSGGISSADPTMQEKTSDYIRLKEGESYTFQVSVNTTEEKWIGIGLYDANKDFIRRFRDTVSSTEIRYTFTVPEGGAWARVSYRTYGIDEDAQLEQGSTATTFEPYKGKKYTTTFGQSITAGGTLDFLTGKLTTGGSTLSLTPQTVKTLVGENHIYASTGDVIECKYSMLINGDDLTANEIIRMDTSVSGITLCRVGKVVTLAIASLSNEIGVSGLTIPYGFRPIAPVTFVGHAYINNQDTWTQGFRISLAGELTARSANNNNAIAVTWAVASTSYITADD